MGSLVVDSLNFIYYTQTICHFPLIISERQGTNVVIDLDKRQDGPKKGSFNNKP